MENKFGIRPLATAKFYQSRRFWKPLLSVIIGAMAGYLYYHFVGCNSGQCAITGNPVISTIWGGMLGLFLINSPCSSGKC